MHTLHQVRRAVYWRVGGHLVNQTISWTSTLLMIRILNPTDYGILAPASLVISFLTLLSSQALSMGLIHERSVNSRQVASVFGYSLVVSISLAILQIAVAPLVAAYYQIPQIKMILYALAVGHLITPFIAIPSALCSRELDFTTTTRVQLIATLAGSAFGIYLAFFGLGVWALVIAQIATLTVKGMALAFYKRWFLRPAFNLRRHSSLLRFGSGVTLVSVLGYAYSQSDILIAGRFLQPHDLGIYSTALMLAQIPASRILPALNDVGFSALSQMRDTPDLIGKAYINNIAHIALVVFPIYLGLACTAEPLIAVVFGPRWIDLVTPIKIMALAMPIYTLHFQYSPYLYALGRPFALAVAPILGLAIMPAAFWAAVGWGPAGLAVAWLVAFPVVAIGSSAIFLPLIGVRYLELLQVLRPAAVASSIMALLLLVVDQMIPIYVPDWIKLIALISTGGGTYAAVIVVLDRQRLLTLRSTIFG